MFSVLFEVNPKADQWDAYLGYAKMLRPELEQIDGFVDNIRYASLTREGWILSLSGWDTEKALVRWRTRARHHEVQEKGRGQVLMDYHLRVGQLTRDTRLPDGHRLIEQRLDETEVGEGTMVTLIDAHRPSEWVHETAPVDVAAWLGLIPDAPGLVSWDIFDTAALVTRQLSALRLSAINSGVTNRRRVLPGKIRVKGGASDVDGRK